MSQNHDPFDLRAQERALKDHDDKARNARQVEQEDVKWLMSSKRGRRIVWRLLEQTGIFRSSFTGNSETFFREGMRNVGLMLMAQINATCPEQYTLMVQEQREHANRNASGNGTN
jgi:hypothetical protein